MRLSKSATLVAASVSLLASASAQSAAPVGADSLFRRVSSFEVFQNTSVDQETVAEIVTYANRGQVLIYTDSATGSIGFIDIADPHNPVAGGVVAVGGEPTSVAVRRRWALAAVNTSADFVKTSGNLEVIDITTRQIVRTIPLGGQPDSVAVSPDGRYAIVAIENERDEDLGNGEPPQAPAGFLVIVDLVGAPAAWTTRTVDLVGVPDLFPEDPEPEFVDISALNIAVVTLQENNYVAFVDLASGAVLGGFSAGTVDLDGVDIDENDLIEQTGSLTGVPREPDGVVWTSNLTFATADEGDLFGGSRGFTNWSVFGLPQFGPGAAFDQLAARLGHYPEDRSENKGSEPESVEYAQFGSQRLLFVGSERANIVAVYELVATPLFGVSAPVLRQVLPTGVAPEGIVAIPERGLFVVANEADARDDGIRSTVMVYELGATASYPTVTSANHAGTSVPIPWGALSGLVAGEGADTLHTIHDSFYRKSRIYTVDHSLTPALITDELPLVDTNGVLAASLDALKLQLPGTDDFDPASLINGDGTVNLDPEGIALSTNGGFWLASEGTGNLVGGVSDPTDRPFESPNLLIEVAADGTIVQVVQLPLEVIQNQLRFGFEGVAVDGDVLYVAFQRAWQAAGDPSDRVRIGRYDTLSASWSFAYYPLDAVASPNGGWVGLSDLTALGGGDFALIERDNQAGPDAAVKRLYRISVAGVTFVPEGPGASFPLLAKTLVSDLLADGAFDASAGPIPEKLEGLAIVGGTTFVVNDNDGVDDNNGETLLLELDGLFR
ncbi:esterase-like activity of phytase family protein [Engelhardtia mirabilis]|uniref:Phytase-like domain-containing protein n=1 Tax=Engelhardtia mirabilis TaxID=2528011 RepID=A0A518BGI2_9BACT|nr:hypothetical protein Pla133_11630 [Planctomycetes bacterium Pla133]QDV00424.1 hypothetical protein Pla86_11630 [Planctomycetes bacterium Pla86]